MEIRDIAGLFGFEHFPEKVRSFERHVEVFSDETMNPKKHIFGCVFCVGLVAVSFYSLLNTVELQVAPSRSPRPVFDLFFRP